MRRFLVAVLAVSLTAGCGRSEQPAQPAPRSDRPGSVTASLAPLLRVDPVRIKRVRAELPAGYEVADTAGVSTPLTYWGLRSDARAEPPQCATLVGPADGHPSPGLSASGDGGQLYVGIAGAESASISFDPVLIGECGQWSMSAGHAYASVTLTEAPAIDGVPTLGMSTVIRTAVESGARTDSTAHTFTASPDGYFVFVTLIVDPGSPNPPLPAEFAAELLVKTVAAVRQ